MKFEISAQPEKKKSFQQMNDQEQQKRFSVLKSLFSYSATSPYREFWENAYKYSDKFNIPGFDTKQTTKLLEEITQLHRMIDNLITCFQEIKIHEETHGNTTKREVAIAELIHGTPGPQLIKKETGKIDKEKTIEGLRWSLETFDKMTDHIGRAHPINPDDQSAILEDVSYIIEKANAYLHRKNN